MRILYHSQCRFPVDVFRWCAPPPRARKNRRGGGGERRPAGERNGGLGVQTALEEAYFCPRSAKAHTIPISPRSLISDLLNMHDLTQMAREYIDIPRRQSLTAAISCWFTMAGFLVIPGTFTSLTHSKKIGETETGRQFQSVMANTPLLPFALAWCFFGTVGTLYMWYQWRRNYISLSREIFQ